MVGLVVASDDGCWWVLATVVVAGRGCSVGGGGCGLMVGGC